MKVYPQLIIRHSEMQFRADYEELLSFGADKFHRLFTRRLKRAFWEHEHGDKRTREKAFCGHESNITPTYSVITAIHRDFSSADRLRKPAETSESRLDMFDHLTADLH
jgi:hypothetical protein